MVESRRGHLDTIEIEGDVTVEQVFGGVRWSLWGEVLGERALGAPTWTGKLRADAVFEPVLSGGGRGLDARNFVMQSRTSPARSALVPVLAETSSPTVPLWIS